MGRRNRVWAALNRNFADRPPKGEIVIDSELVRHFPVSNLEEVLAYLNADLVTLKIDEKIKVSNWRYWQEQDYFSFGLLQGPFTLMLDNLGWNETSYLIVRNPEETEKLMKKYLTESRVLADEALSSGCEGIILADDLADNRGLIISPDYLQNYYFPVLSKLLEKLNRKYIPFIFHSDGNILDIVPMLKNTGFWGIQSLQPSAGININSFSGDLVEDWVFWGNFAFEDKYEMKTAQKVKTDVENLLAVWREVPGYIFGSSGGLYRGIPAEIIKTAYDIVHECKY